MKTSHRCPFPLRECGECYWFVDALLDGDPEKGICHFDSAQRRPFVMSPGDRVKIVQRTDLACEDFKGFGFDCDKMK